MTEQPDKPWVLLMRGREPWRFATRDKAMNTYNSMRFAPGGIKPVYKDRVRLSSNAALRGPDGEGWRCGAGRHEQWTRDDDAWRPFVDLVDMAKTEAAK